MTGDDWLLIATESARLNAQHSLTFCGTSSLLRCQVGSSPRHSAPGSERARVCVLVPPRVSKKRRWRQSNKRLPLTHTHAHLTHTHTHEPLPIFPSPWVPPREDGPSTWCQHFVGEPLTEISCHCLPAVTSTKLHLTWDTGKNKYLKKKKIHLPISFIYATVRQYRRRECSQYFQNKSTKSFQLSLQWF